MPVIYVYVYSKKTLLFLVYEVCVFGSPDSGRLPAVLLGDASVHLHLPVINCATKLGVHRNDYDMCLFSCKLQSYIVVSNDTRSKQSVPVPDQALLNMHYVYASFRLVTAFIFFYEQNKSLT